MNDFLDFSPAQLEALINDVYGGVVTPTNLPRDLYEAINKVLIDAVESGFGTDYGDGSVSSNLLTKFRKNVSVFSAAKTYQQVNDMSNFVIGEDGTKLPFSEFKKYAEEIFDTYNKNWLKTEQDTAFALAQSAQNWVQIEEQADVLPLLRFQTVGDGRVRDNHKVLDDIVKPVKDKFWNDNYPPLDWNCRCIVTQHAAGELPITSDKAINDKDLPPIPLLFRGNPAKDGYIFNEDVHPYFKVDEKYSISTKKTPAKPKAKPKTEKEVEKPKPVEGFVTASNVKQAREIATSIIEKNSNIKVKSVTFSTDLSLERVNTRLETINDLFSQYEVNFTNRANAEATRIIFKSTKSTYGSVTRSLSRAEGSQIKAINFGDATDTAKNRVFDELATATRPKSRVDLVNIDKATVTHEFAHVIAISQEYEVVNAAPKLKEFIKELNLLKNEYTKELNSAWLARDKEGFKPINKISLGKYASTNLNEFMAEGFTEYKLSSKPSKYASQIGKLIDKYFKK
jgi:hypothetical protein